MRVTEMAQEMRYCLRKLGVNQKRMEKKE